MIPDSTNAASIEQTLLFTVGCGWVQRDCGQVEEVYPGDVVWFSPGERHWHGATATTAMTLMDVQAQRCAQLIRKKGDQIGGLPNRESRE